ncbi:substrate-binding periplasmic protein [Sedimenticola selenatireducens]|uniref:Amino acid ABC transporter substrate-binding protein n=1 Tax=Sedimenticola selenatireducens TaxID=191960 RepID=A0A557S542_9GAMM|nr:transporter substrate-binding domain-containing protein [Sedimenticola selenatireducens]TVO72539.1 amino acid ABC transporter substrate-binding protein [Sedimenticola selenatireducens]TVT64793.1 MAG: amino acid ABC transporter substrate-binding protein [Sedimenticola selenatireducens]
MDPTHKRVTTSNTIFRVVGLLILLSGSSLNDSAAASDAEVGPIKLVTAHLVPYSIQEGREQGFMVDLIREIERRLGTNRPVLFMPWPRAIRNTRIGPNHIVFPLTRTIEREPHFDWAINVAPIELVFVTLSGKKLTLQQARSLSAIAVQQNTPFEQYLRQQGFTNLVITTSAAPIPIRMLRAGRVNAWFTAKDLASYSMREQFVTETITYSDSITSGNVYFALSKQFPVNLKQAYQETFSAMQSDGTYQKIMDRYVRN